MPTRITIPCLLLLAATAACGEKRCSRSPSATAAAPSSPQPAPMSTQEIQGAESERTTCGADDDCMASCHHGAVSRAWHKAAYPGEESCEGGCTAKGTEPPRCRGGRCVAYRAGAPDPACTDLDRPVIAGPGPAHRCTKSEDCTPTCGLGVVNRSWLSWQSPGPDCRGGCLRAGWEEPRCEAGKCVAYHLGQRDPLCTEIAVER
jgi:hypothetical protein